MSMIDFLYHWCQLFGSIPMERKEAKTQQIHRKKSVSTIGMIHFCASMFMPNAEKDTSFKNWQLPKKVSFLAEISRSLSVSLNSRLSRLKKSRLSKRQVTDWSHSLRHHRQRVSGPNGPPPRATWWCPPVTMNRDEYGRNFLPRC